MKEKKGLRSTLTHAALSLKPLTQWAHSQTRTDKPDTPPKKNSLPLRRSMTWWMQKLERTKTCQIAVCATADNRIARHTRIVLGAKSRKFTARLRTTTSIVTKHSDLFVAVMAWRAYFSPTLLKRWKTSEDGWWMVQSLSFRAGPPICPLLLLQVSGHVAQV